MPALKCLLDKAKYYMGTPSRQILFAQDEYWAFTSNDSKYTCLLFYIVTFCRKLWTTVTPASYSSYCKLATSYSIRWKLQVHPPSPVMWITVCIPDAVLKETLPTMLCSSKTLSPNTASAFLSSETLGKGVFKPFPL
jgi:hypothetical protein